jgi:hypothetical protein
MRHARAVGIVPAAAAVVAASMPLVLARSHDTFEIAIRHHATTFVMDADVPSVLAAAAVSTIIGRGAIPAPQGAGARGSHLFAAPTLDGKAAYSNKFFDPSLALLAG